MIDIKTINEFEFTRDHFKAVLFYFSHEQCNVCKVLKPKVSEMVNEHYPEMKVYSIDTAISPEISGQNQVFSVPTIICFFEGKEGFRKSRNIGIDQLLSEIKRPYEFVTGKMNRMIE